MKTKDKYIKPVLDVCDLYTSQSFMTSSPGSSIGAKDEEADGNGDVLGNKRRGTWGDLWTE